MPVLWLAPPATSLEVAAKQWLGGVPRGTKWGAQGSSVLFPGAATLECCHHGWNHPRSALYRGGTRWYRTQNWNSCSRLLPQPQPLPLSIPCLSIAHLKGNHPLQSWVLCPQTEWKICLAWRGWAQPSLIQWLHLHRHPWLRLCQNTSQHHASQSLTFPTCHVKNPGCSQ